MLMKRFRMLWIEGRTLFHILLHTCLVMPQYQMQRKSLLQVTLSKFILGLLRKDEISKTSPIQTDWNNNGRNYISYLLMYVVKVKWLQSHL